MADGRLQESPGEEAGAGEGNAAWCADRGSSGDKATQFLKLESEPRRLRIKGQITLGNWEYCVDLKAERPIASKYGSHVLK